MSRNPTDAISAADLFDWTDDDYEPPPEPEDETEDDDADC